MTPEKGMMRLLSMLPFFSAGLLPGIQESAPAGSQESAPDTRPADLIVLGQVFTGDPVQPSADAIAIRGDLIVEVGEIVRVRALAGRKTRVLRKLSGSIVPGFNDAHSHLATVAAIDADVDLASAARLDQALAQLKEWALKHPEDPVVQGRGLAPSLLDPTPGSPPLDAGMLDAAVADRPALLWAAGMARVLANTKALEHLEALDEDALPPSIQIYRDGEGKPTGWFRGRALLELFASLALPPREVVREKLRAGFREANRNGITSVHEPLPRCLLVPLRELHDAGELSIRLHVLVDPAGPLPPRELSSGDGWITFGVLQQSASSACCFIDELRDPSVPVEASSRDDSIVLVTPASSPALFDFTPEGETRFEKRRSELLALRKHLDQGATLALGSCYDRWPFDPRRGLVALTRVVPSRSPGAPSASLTLAEALRATTLGGAQAAGAEREKGQIVTDKLADLVVFEQNLFNLEPGWLLKAEIRATIVGGKVVYQR